MDRKEIKNIVMSMRTPENESMINNILGKLDLMDETSLQQAVEKVGGTKETVKLFFEKKFAEKQHSSEEHKPINKMFSYGITDRYG